MLPVVFMFTNDQSIEGDYFWSICHGKGKTIQYDQSPHFLMKKTEKGPVLVAFYYYEDGTVLLLDTYANEAKRTLEKHWGVRVVTHGEFLTCLSASLLRGAAHKDADRSGTNECRHLTAKPTNHDPMMKANCDHCGAQIPSFLLISNLNQKLSDVFEEMWAASVLKGQAGKAAKVIEEAQATNGNGQAK